MKNIVCHVCDSNRPYNEYTGDKLLDEFGNKACFDCLMEAGVFDEEDEVDDDNEY